MGVPGERVNVTGGSGVTGGGMQGWMVGDGMVMAPCIPGGGGGGGWGGIHVSIMDVVAPLSWRRLSLVVLVVSGSALILNGRRYGAGLIMAL